jgi:hypothetical protein
MPQAVPTKVLVAELGHDLVPMRRIAQDGSRDAPTTGTGEQSGVGLAIKSVDPPLHHLTHLNDERHNPSALALCPLVGESTRGWRGLPADRP